IAQSCPSATAAVPHPNSITIFPASSSPARAEEGTRQVASYSSTISGPVLPPPRSERRTTGVLPPPCAAPSHAGRGGGGGRLRPVGSDPVGHAAVTESQTHHLDRYQLNRFVWAGAMAIGALVLLRERG